MYHNPKKNFSLRVSATHLCPSKTVHISRSPISGVLFPRQEGGHEIILTRRERGFGNFSLEEARDEVMFLPPILLGLDQIHLAFCHHVVDGPQIAEVLFLHKPRLDRVLTFLCEGTVRWPERVWRRGAVGRTGRMAREGEREGVREWEERGISVLSQPSHLDPAQDPQLPI